MSASAGPSLMRREIGEIPDVVSRVVAAADEIAPVAAAMRESAPAWVTVAGRGTSDHAAVFAQYLFETQLGLPSGLAKPSVTTHYGARLTWDGGMLLAISQSGQSPDVAAVVEAAQAGGALTVAITNDDDSPVARAAAYRLGCHAGVERAVPATKTYVAELTVLAALVAAISPDGGLGAGLGTLAGSVGGAIAVADAWIDGPGTRAVEELAAADRALVLSRGFNLATALELALKLKETVGLFAEPYSTADFAHGPRVLARSAVPILTIRPDGPMGADVDETLASANAAGRDPIVIGGRDAARYPRGLVVPLEVPEALSPIVLVVPGQLLVEAVAQARGVSPDAPIGLEKVTRTR